MIKNEKLINKMTLEEKASLMSGKDFWQTKNIDHLNISSIFLADGPHGIRKQQEAADHLGLNESIPATCFPTAATVANSWNEELGEKIGSYLGKEALVQKVNVLLGPGINMKRNPLCGRNFEYFSEDPYHTGKLAAAYIRGIQSEGVAACVKHFAVNNQEERRMSIDTIVDERTLREIYLTAFEIAVKEGNTKTLMSSYNKLNGIYTNENQHIMIDILRKEWNFDGVVVTDWGGSNNRVEGLKAGNELEMPTANDETNQEIIEAVKSGKIKEKLLDEAVDRMITLISDTEISPEEHTSFDIESHHMFAQKVAEDSIVLLKNEEDILPLDPNKTVAVIGDFAKNPRYQGAGSSIVNPTKLDTTLDSIKEVGLTSIGYAQGYNRYGKKSSKLIDEACKLAKKADVVLLYVGLDEVTEVEGLDRNDLKIPENQIELIHCLSKVNQNIVAILSSGSVVEVPWISEVKGLVHGYLAGQAGAKAILRILTGEVNPSGKLAETYPLLYQDTPSANFFPGKEVSVEYREGPYIGYRYYDTVGKEVRFPFGYGLSYTSFEYSDLKIDQTGVRFAITNKGLQDGKEIAQLYIGLNSEKIYRPKKELKGFEKVFLKSGETKYVFIPFDDKTFRYFDTVQGKWQIESGNYTVQIGSSSLSIHLEEFYTVSGIDPINSYDKNEFMPYYTGKIKEIGLTPFEKLLGYRPPSPKWDRSKPLEYNDTIAQMQYAKGLFARFSFKTIEIIYRFLKKIGKRETANLIMMSVYHMPFRGIARMTGGIVNMPMIDGLLIAINGRFFKGSMKIIKEKINLRKNK